MFTRPQLKGLSAVPFVVFKAFNAWGIMSSMNSEPLKAFTGSSATKRKPTQINNSTVEGNAYR